MTFRSLFADTAHKLIQRDWRDPKLNEFAQLLYEFFTSEKPIELHVPLELNNNTDGPALKIVNKGQIDHHGISITDKSGAVVKLGVGMGSQGVISNEIVPDPNFTIDSREVHGQRSTIGMRGNVSRSGLGVGASGGGISGVAHPFVPVAGLGAMFASWQKSGNTQHPPDAADLLTRNGNPLWVIRQLLGFCVVRCQIDTVNNDDLACTVIGGSDTITVAKDCHLQKTPWHGNTIDGWTYTYSDAQTRVLSHASKSDINQIVYPPYYEEGHALDTCPHIYARWSGNGTGLSNISYIDVNAAGRTWRTTGDVPT